MATLHIVTLLPLIGLMDAITMAVLPFISGGSGHIYIFIVITEV
jgi:hypothetical protein